MRTDNLQRKYLHSLRREAVSNSTDIDSCTATAGRHRQAVKRSATYIHCVCGQRT